MEKYIRGIEELGLGRRVTGGSCSSIYEFDDGTYFKEFNEDYRDLSDPINEEFLETINCLSNIKGMPYIVRGKTIYRSQLELFGYSMPKVLATGLEDMDDGILIDTVLDSFGRLSKDIRVLSDNYVKTEDIGGDNILYNGNMYLLDLDLSLIDRRYIPDELYEKTCISVLCAIKRRLLGDSRRSDAVDVGCYLDYFQGIREVCEEESGREIRTVGEFRKVYQKVKSNFTLI